MLPGVTARRGIRLFLSIMAVFLAGILGGCATATNWSGIAGAREINYANPPGVGAFLQPQSGMVTCERQDTAIAMALTGFFADGCKTLEKPDTWQVVSIEFKDMGNEQTLWLVEIRSSGALDSSGEPTTLWSPLPWHDWA